MTVSKKEHVNIWNNMTLDLYISTLESMLHLKIYNAVINCFKGEWPTKEDTYTGGETDQTEHEQALKQYNLIHFETG